MAWIWGRSAVRGDGAAERVAEAAVTSSGFDETELERPEANMQSEVVLSLADDRLQEALQDATQLDCN
jgi:hypothetical protein